MPSSIKSLTKQTLIYGVGTILTRFVTFLLLPLYTNLLSPEDYGLASLVFAFLGFMNIVFIYGLDSAFMRFYSDDIEKSKRATILSTATWMTLSTSAVFSIIIYSYAFPLGKVLLSSVENGLFIRYAAAILFFDCISHVPFALIRLEEKPFQFMGIRLLNVVITFGLNIYFVGVLKVGIIGIFRSNLIASTITALLLYAFTIPRIGFLFSGSTAKELAFFGLPFVPAGLASVSMEMLNRYILEYKMDLSAVGIFSTGFKLGIFMLLVTTAFYYAWQPFFLKAGKRESSRPLFSRILTYFVLVTLSIWVILTAIMHEIVHFNVKNFFLIGPEYHECESIIPIILLGYVFFGINQVFLPGIYFEKKTRYLAYITLVASVVNIAANFIFIPMFGILGSAIASLLGYIILSSLTYFASQSLFKVHYEYFRVALLFLIAFAAAFPIFLFSLSLPLRISIAIAFPVLLRLFGFFKKEELELVKTLFRSRGSN